jgi:hypothetical protein
MIFIQNTFRNISNYLTKSSISVTTEPLKKADLNKKKFVAPWGITNNFPKELDDKIAHSEGLETGFQTLTDFAYGLRIATYQQTVDENGNFAYKRVIVPAFEEFMQEYNFKDLYLGRAIYNFFRYANVFVEFTVFQGKIIRLFTKDAPFCRVSSIDPKLGVSTHMLESAQWADLKEASFDKLKEYEKAQLLHMIPLIDQRNPIVSIQELAKKNSILGYQIKDYSPGDPYYGQSPWYPILSNGWLDILRDTPNKIKAYYSNLITLAFEIGIDIDFVKETTPDWDKLGEKEKRKVFEDLQQKIDDYLSGADKSYKSIFYQKRMNGQAEQKMLTINSLENKNRDSTILKDAQHLNAVLNSALRIDNALNNSQHTGSAEADSGSEKTKANNLLQLRLAPIRDQILYPLYLLKKINNWGDHSIHFVIESDIQTTTDINITGKETQPMA